MININKDELDKHLRDLDSYQYDFHTPVCELCGSELHEWNDEPEIFYCVNKECFYHNLRIDFRR
jgi:hypothetical protein